MRPISIDVRNFLTFEEASYTFPDFGLYLVLGENNFVEMADNNGSGKSNFFIEAFYWCVFGKSVKGYAPDRVVRQGSKGGCRVAAHLESNGHDILVERYRKDPEFKNKMVLTIDGDSESHTLESNLATLNHLVEILGQDADSFAKTSLHDEDSLFGFAKASDAEQKRFLERVLDLGVYRKAHEIVKSRCNDTQMELKAATSKMEMLHREKEGAEKQIEETVAKFEAFEEEKKRKLKTVDEDISGVKKEIRALRMKKFDDTLIREKKTLLEQSNDVWKDVRKAQIDKTRVEDSITRIEKTIDGSKKDLENIKSLTCRSCGQDLPEDQKKLRENSIQEALERDGKTLKKAKLTLDKINEFLTKNEGKMLDSAEVKRLSEMISKEEYKKSTNALEIMQKENLLSVFEKTREEFDRENPYGSFFDDLDKKVRNIDAKIKKAQSGFDELQDRLVLEEFWLTGFSDQGIKSLVLDSVTPFLDERVDIFSDILTDGHIRITFSTLRKLKTGEYRDKFSVNIDSDLGAETHKEASGGEKRRIDLAVMLALCDLSEARYGNPGLIVFDEVFDKLDQTGIERTLGVLNEMAKDRCVIVITHNKDLIPLFQHLVIVKRGKDGISRIEG